MSTAMVLAAGIATRLRPLTDHLPKCLLPVGGEPLLGRWIRQLAAAGFSRVLVNTHHHADRVREYCESHAFEADVVLTYEAELLGSAGTLRANAAWLRDGDLFGVAYADTFVDSELSSLVVRHAARRPLVTLGLFDAPEPERSGIVELDPNGLMIGFEEKPARPRSSLAFAGVAVASPDLLEMIPALTPCDFAGSVISQLSGRAEGVRLAGYVADIGTVAAYARVQADVAAMRLSS